MLRSILIFFLLFAASFAERAAAGSLAQPGRHGAAAADRAAQQEQEQEQQDEPQAAENEILIIDQRPVTAASDQTIRDRDFANFPRRTASDLMRLVPGLHITQHTGGAKAHQIFLRGFDAEHGQDIAASLDGIPLNEVSHVHGQGYLDLHFLIPEVVRRIRVLKGPYDPRLGNFSTAGSIHFETEPALPDDQTARLRFGAGRFKTLSGLAQLAVGGGDRRALLALQANRSDGFTDPGELAAVRAFARGRMLDRKGWRLDALYAGYAARSTAADTLPLSWIRQGEVDRFAALDPTNRVDVDRHLAGLVLTGPAAGGRLRLLGHYQFKDTRIFSNFTYYYFDPVRGDQLEQSDMRHFGGLQARWTDTAVLPAAGALVSELGVQWRMDAVWQTQAHTEARKRLDVLNHYVFQEHGLGVYARETWLPAERWTLVGGLRYDAQLVDVEGWQDVKELDIYTNRVVVRSDQPRRALAHAHIVSPSLSLAYALRPSVDLFANVGRDFVTRPARAQANREKHVPYGVTAAELGSRYTALGGALSLAGALWWTHKDRELVFDSEFGGTVFRGQSHRLGLELEARWAPVDWAWLATDLFLTWTRLQAEQGWGPIPNTPWLLMTNAAAIQHPIGLQLAVRGRLLGPREHDLGLRSDAYYVVDLVLAWQSAHWGLRLTVENLFDAEWYDSVFAYPVRPAPGAPVEQGLQVTPGTPFYARLTMSLKI